MQRSDPRTSACIRARAAGAIRGLLLWPATAISIGCGGDEPVARVGDLVITRAVAPAPVGDGPAALYFTVVNRGSAADTLVTVATPAAAEAMVHDQVRRGGSMTMEHVGALAVPAGDSVRLAPGGLHVMLSGRRTPITAGDTLQVTLTFRRAGVVALRVPVVTYSELDGRT